MKSKKRQLLDNAKEVKNPRARRMFVTVNKTDFQKSMRKLVKSEGFRHLSTITGIDVGSAIEVIYHLIREGQLLSLKVKTPKKNPVLPSIVDLIPGAVLYEREVHDLLGVTFEGNPDLSPLLLSDDWPSDIYPMRKDLTPQAVEKVAEEP